MLRRTTGNVALPEARQAAPTPSTEALVAELERLRDASELMALAMDDLRVELAFAYPGLSSAELDRLACIAVGLALTAKDQPAL